MRVHDGCHQCVGRCSLILGQAFHFSKIFDLANLRMCAASNGDSKVIIALIAARANVNDINERGAPWLWTCMQG